jgi:phosphorylcholine metabolism protein LicD
MVKTVETEEKLVPKRIKVVVYHSKPNYRYSSKMYKSLMWKKSRKNCNEKSQCSWSYNLSCTSKFYLKTSPKAKQIEKVTTIIRLISFPSYIYICQSLRYSL